MKKSFKGMRNGYETILEPDHFPTIDVSHQKVKYMSIFFQAIKRRIRRLRRVMLFNYSITLIDKA